MLRSEKSPRRLGHGKKKEELDQLRLHSLATGKSNLSVQVNARQTTRIWLLDVDRSQLTRRR